MCRRLLYALGFSVPVFASSYPVVANWSFDYLAQPKYSLSVAQVRSKAIFVSQTQYEIYDFNTGLWKKSEISRARGEIAAAAAVNKAYFAGGRIGPSSRPDYVRSIDIYDYSSDSWTVGRLSQPRKIGGSGSVCTKVLFAGGKREISYSDRVDIFDALSGACTTGVLCQPRDCIAVGTAAGKLVFAGGEKGALSSPESSDRVDIYDANTGLWSEAKLSSSRSGMAVASVTDLIFFAGGIRMSSIVKQPELSHDIDIYNAKKNQWMYARLSEPKYGITVFTSGRKVYFVGGIIDMNGNLSDKIEIFDTETGKWSYATLSAPRAGMAVGKTEKRVLLAGGAERRLEESTNRVDVFNSKSSDWQTELLFRARQDIAVASFDNKVIFAGGFRWNGLPELHKEPSGAVDIWKEAPEEIEAGTTVCTNTDDVLRVSNEDIPPSYVESSDEALECYLSINLEPFGYNVVKVNVFDEHRSRVLSHNLLSYGNSFELMDVSSLPSGKYWVQITCNGFKPVVKTLIIRKIRKHSPLLCYAKLKSMGV